MEIEHKKIELINSLSESLNPKENMDKINFNSNLRSAEEIIKDYGLTKENIL